MSIVYRTAGGWGSGVGRPLVAAEVDTNFYTHDQAITALQALPLGVSISSIVQTAPNLIVINLTDGRSYTFTLPVLTFNWRGSWAPNTWYNVYDIVSVTSPASTYLVVFGHFSAATFDPNASDGAGHKYYQLMIQAPNPLPVDGATNTVLAKNSAADYDTKWIPGVPNAGAAGSALFKNSTADWDMLWRSVNFTDVIGNPSMAQLRAPTNSILTSTAGVVTLNPSLGNVFNLTPTANTTINASAAPVDARIVVFVIAGATAYNITFGSSFKSAGVLNSGTVTGQFSVSFAGDGNFLYELSRSGPF